jgi:hypothetical protein
MRKVGEYLGLVEQAGRYDDDGATDPVGSDDGEKRSLRPVRAVRRAPPNDTGVIL